jgi:enoyl-CoA hydratase
MSTEYETLQLRLTDGIASIVLNRPESRNALNLQMCRDLTRLCDHLQQDADVRVILVVAEGSSFCAGADLKERKDMTTSDILARRVEGFTAYAALEALAVPTIAVIQGPAYGSGAEIAACCDFALASSAASFKYPEIGWGTVGATQRLPRIVGARMAKELLFTGRVVQAQEALALGLVNHVHAPDELQSKAWEMATLIASHQPITTRLMKQSIKGCLETTPEGAMAVELIAIQENLRKSDWRKAISGFGTKNGT